VGAPGTRAARGVPVRPPHESAEPRRSGSPGLHSTLDAETHSSTKVIEERDLTVAADQNKIDEFVFGLKYDPAVILAIVKDGDKIATPVRDRSKSSTAVIITTKTRHSLAKNLSDIAMLRPTGGVVWAGALVKADEQLMDGQPTPISGKRAPMTISVDLPGLDKSGVEVKDPSTSAVQDAVTKLVKDWLADPNHRGWVNPARSYFEMTSAYTSQQASLDMSINAKWATGDAAAQITVSSDSKVSTVMAYYKQVFYTATMDTPTTPGSVFDPSVTVKSLTDQGVGDKHPPAYIRSVDYGRILMIKMSTSTSETSANLRAAFQQATEAASGGVKIDGKYSSILQSSTFQVLALGGGAPKVAKFTGSDEGLKELKNYITDGSTLAPGNPGIAISYNVAFLKDNVLAAMGFTTDYTETESVVYPNGWIGLWQDGWYVARFKVTWQDLKDDGSLGPEQKWESGNMTLGQTHKLQLAGDATTIRIIATEDSGLGWWDAMDTVENGPTNRWYRIYGTTLGPHWDNKPYD
jgi:thiol-activated cytolysin